MSVVAVAVCPGCGDPSGLYGPRRLCWGCWAEEKGGSRSTAPSETEQAEQRLLFLTPRELRQHSPPEPEWVWSGYVARGGVTLLAGLPKVGKSTLACALVEAVRSGAPQFLGRRVVGSPVVVLTEESAFTLLDKLPASDEVRVLVRENAYPLPAWPELVAAAVDECKRIRAHLLVVDSLAFWAQFGAEAENDAGSAARAFAPLHEAAGAGLAVLLPVHQRKSGGEGGTAIRGSGAIAASADMLLELERVEGSPRHRQLLSIGRWPSPPLLLIDYDPREGSWRVVGEGEGREDAAGLSWRERILSALPGAEPGATYADLELTVGTQKNKFLVALNALVAEGLVSAVGQGRKGDPRRFWRTPDSVTEFHSQAVMETREQPSAAVSIFHSTPIGGMETETPRAEPIAVPIPERNGTDPEAAASLPGVEWVRNGGAVGHWAWRGEDEGPF